MYQITTPIRSSVTGKYYGLGAAISDEEYASLPATEQNHFKNVPGDIDAIQEQRNEAAIEENHAAVDNSHADLDEAVNNREENEPTVEGQGPLAD